MTFMLNETRIQTEPVLDGCNIFFLRLILLRFNCFCKNVHKSFGKTCVVNNLSFGIQNRECFGLLGFFFLYTLLNNMFFAVPMVLVKPRQLVCLQLSCLCHLEKFLVRGKF